MPEVGVRDLKTYASEIIRDVRERRARYTVTYRGRPVGLLIPLDEARSASLPISEGPTTNAWDELIRLGEEIGRGWRSSQSSVEILSRMRR